MYFTYSRWNGQQDGYSLDADAIIDAAIDGVLAGNSVDEVIERLTQFGFPDEPFILGTAALLQEALDRRRTEEERYDLTSILPLLSEGVQAAVAEERSGIDRRKRATQTSSSRGELENQLALDKVAEHHGRLLSDMPTDPLAALGKLAEYDFLDSHARERCNELLEKVQSRVVARSFDALEDSLRRLSNAEYDELANALRALNNLIEDGTADRSREFDAFREQYGAHFPNSTTLGGLISELREQSLQTYQLLHGMPASMRTRLDRALRTASHNEQLQNEMDRFDTLAGGTPSGANSPLGAALGRHDEALAVLHRLARLDALSAALQCARRPADLRHMELDELCDLLGEQFSRSVQAIRSLDELVLRAGYCEMDGGSLRLSARGENRVGAKVLRDVFRRMKHASRGEHVAESGGYGPDRSTATRAYEWGDPAHLDPYRTVMNAVSRGERLPGLTLRQTDFEVIRPERASRAATVLLLDMSRSMELRGCSVAARRVVLALHALIQRRYPSDVLYLVGFSDKGRVLTPHALLHAQAFADGRGTNMQHGLLLARKLLSRHKSDTRQIVLLTDGEPTCHFEGHVTVDVYPPSHRTAEATLKEVEACARTGIGITTYMLAVTPNLVDFVHRIAKVSRGRALFASPERVDEYVVRDYTDSRS